MSNRQIIDIRQLCLYLANKYNIDYEQARLAAGSQFSFVRKVMEEANALKQTADDVRLPLFGKFHVKPATMRRLHKSAKQKHDKKQEVIDKHRKAHNEFIIMYARKEIKKLRKQISYILSAVGGVGPLPYEHLSIARMCLGATLYELSPGHDPYGLKPIGTIVDDPDGTGKSFQATDGLPGIYELRDKLKKMLEHMKKVHSVIEAGDFGYNPFTYVMYHRAYEEMRIAHMLLGQTIVTRTKSTDEQLQSNTV